MSASNTAFAALPEEPLQGGIRPVREPRLPIVAALVGILSLAVILRPLSIRSVWLDEAIRVEAARLPFLNMTEGAATQGAKAARYAEEQAILRPVGCGLQPDGGMGGAQARAALPVTDKAQALPMGRTA
jgi:hypothetical protein